MANTCCWYETRIPEPLMKILIDDLDKVDENPGYEIDTTVYSVENKRKIETSDHYMYEVKDISRKK